jgi:hypothetical protein
MRRTKKAVIKEESIKIKKRRRTAKLEPSKKYICGAANSCWFRGQCPHRVAHEKINCDETFCSVINLKNCHCEEVK